MLSEIEMKFRAFIIFFVLLGVLPDIYLCTMLPNRVEADGEVPGTTPVTIELTGQQINVIVA